MTKIPALRFGHSLFILVLVGITIAVAVALNSSTLPAGNGAGTGTLTGNVPSARSVRLSRAPFPTTGLSLRTRHARLPYQHQQEPLSQQ
jgi:hypothetical protein